jgi:flagellar basal body-associated protein FliL
VNKKMLIIVGVVLLLVAGVGAKMTVLKAPPPDEKALAKEPGPVYTMAEPFVVNLADGDSPHFAKVGIAMRFSALSAGDIIPAKGDVPAEVEDDSELRDIIIGTLQSKTSGDLGSPEGREEVKKAIVAKVNKHTKLRILDVYYTEFAVQ